MSVYVQGTLCVPCLCMLADSIAMCIFVCVLAECLFVRLHGVFVSLGMCWLVISYPYLFYVCVLVG